MPYIGLKGSVAHAGSERLDDEPETGRLAGELAPRGWQFCAPGASSPRSALRVLVVDPSPALRQLFSLELREAGYPTIDTESLEDAMHLVGSDPPDAIVLNATLTPASGAQFVRILRLDRRMAPVPVVAVAFSPGSERELLDAGADCCLRRVPAAGDILKAVDWVLSVYGDRQGSLTRGALLQVALLSPDDRGECKQPESERAPEG
jgi:CheY-like chemotaxis protein